MKNGGTKVEFMQLGLDLFSRLWLDFDLIYFYNLSHQRTSWAGLMDIHM